MHDSFFKGRFWLRMTPLDTIDRKIMAHVQRHGRATHVELAAAVHLSPPQCFRRLRALEERGVIRGWAAQVAPGEVGFGVTAFVTVRIAGSRFGRAREVERELAGHPEILECHAVSGDHDYLLKVVAADLKALSVLLTDRLMRIDGIDDVRSMIALEEIKPPSPLPV